MQTRLYLCSATALGALLVGLPAASPTSAASADPTPRALAVAPGSIRHDSPVSAYELKSVLTTKQLEELLATLPIGAGPGSVSPEALSKALAALPALQALNIEGLEPALKAALESLGSGQTLEEALQNPAALAPKLAQTLEEKLLPGELLALKGLLGGTTLSEGLAQALGQVDDSELLHELLTSSGGPWPQSTLEKMLGGNSKEAM